jgi:coproporphyrinogen III oxidase-like Fe-S oxidoreductase
MAVGWHFDEFRRTTGYDLQAEWSQEIADLTKRGWGQASPERFHLTSEGLRFADAAAELFLR